MAQRRLNPVLEPPSSVVDFDEDEWMAPGDKTSWGGFQRWKDARHRWVKAHGPETSLGSIVDVFREERTLWEARNGYVA